MLWQLKIQVSFDMLYSVYYEVKQDTSGYFLNRPIL